MPPAALTDDSMRQQILSGASRRSWAGVQTGFLMLERRNRPRQLKAVPHHGQAAILCLVRPPAAGLTGGAKAECRVIMRHTLR